MKLCHAFVVESLAIVALVAGCGGEPAAPPAAPPSVATAPTPPPAQKGSPTEQPATPLAMPTTGQAANHYLADDTVFAANAPFTSNTLYADPAQPLAPPGPDGKASLWNFVSNKEMQTAHFWRTRPAKPDELAVGLLALMPNRKDGQGVYVAPGSAKDAYQSRWWITRIVSVRPLGEGYVLVAGNYKVAPNAIRFLEGDPSPAIRQQGKEDAHFLADEHWFVGNAPLPEKNHIYLDPAVPVRPDAPLEGGEGRFVQTNNGNIALTAHAWQTRPATRQELKPGLLVVAPNLKDGSVYRAPRTRGEALSTRWWAVKIDSTKNLAKGTVGVEGRYEIAVDSLRVVK